MLNKTQKLGLLIVIIVMGFSIAVVFHYVQGVYWGRPYPQNTFLFNPVYRFCDFTYPVMESADLDPYQPDKYSSLGAYAPFGYLIAYLFSLIKPWWLAWGVFLCLFLVPFVLLIKHFLYGLKAAIPLQELPAIPVLAFLTYPVIFAVDRSNFDLLLCIGVFLFALAYAERRFKTSAVFLALAIAFKPFYAVFAVIYLFDRRFREVALTAFCVIALTVFSLSLFEDGLFTEAHKFITASVSSGKAITDGTTFHFTSDSCSFLVIAVRSVSSWVSGSPVDLLESRAFMWCYLGAAALVFLCFAGYLWRRPQPLWKAMAILTILLILLPPFTGDYRLTFLFIPLLMYLRSDEGMRNDLAIVVLWGLLLVPKNYYNMGEHQNIGMVINPLLLVALLFCIVSGWPSGAGISSAWRSVGRRLQPAGRTGVAGDRPSGQ